MSGVKRTSEVQQSVGATVVLVLATVVFSMVLSGSYLNYLQPWLGPYLLVASIVMGVLGLWTLLEAAERGGDGHKLPGVAALLLVPSLLFGVAAPGALGPGAGIAPPAAQPSDTEVIYPPLPADEVSELSLADFSDRYVSPQPEDLEGKRVRLLGFVDVAEGGKWSINRFRVLCCVADAYRFTVIISGQPMPEGENVWVEVEGVIDLKASGDEPVLVADAVDIVNQPEEPYL